MKRKKLNLTSNSSNSILYKKKKKKKYYKYCTRRWISIDINRLNRDSTTKTISAAQVVNGRSLSDTVVILFMNHPSIPADRMFPIVLKNWIESHPSPSRVMDWLLRNPYHLLPNRPQTDSTAVLSCSPFQQATTIFWLRGSVHARRLRRCTTRSGGGATIASLRDTTAEQMPDLQNRGAVNNREMKRTECLFAKIRDRGRSVPLYAACRVWRCDRYMDGIMEKKREKRKKRGRGGNRGKKMGTIRKRPLLFGTARAMVSGRIDRCADRVRGVHNFWMILELWIVYLFEIFGRR